jgi:hypothetical protein
MRNTQVGIIKLLKLLHSNVLYVHRKVAKKWNLDLLSLIAGVQIKVPDQRHWKIKMVCMQCWNLRPILKSWTLAGFEPHSRRISHDWVIQGLGPAKAPWVHAREDIIQKLVGPWISASPHACSLFCFKYFHTQEVMFGFFKYNGAKYCVLAPDLQNWSKKGSQFSALKVP